MTATRRLGVLLGGSTRPEDVVGLARLSERLGFDELWLTEDYFYGGGVSMATAALQATERLVIGLGVVSALTRHPALLAMDLATMARCYPGRLRPGIGLGLPEWLEQMGLRPASLLGAMRESMAALRDLLDGKTVHRAGTVFTLDGIKLEYPPTEPLPLDMGVVGPKMLELAGEVADGSIPGGLNASPAYIRWAREQIARGAARPGAPASHRITAFAVLSVDEDGAKARAEARRTVGLYLGLSGVGPMTDTMGISEELAELLAKHGPDGIAEAMPDSWLEELAVVGTPAECIATIDRFFAAGTDALILYPVPTETAGRALALIADAGIDELGPSALVGRG